ncbi:epithelial discoidin domain-containing receptor 1-like, partial [Corapipo altera]|uniref:epithelial discoidin domain-containing receptor 1-like n=1 Tax=Corapipo altera TaxID=415028 RepID=UPI000FD6A032
MPLDPAPVVLNDSTYDGSSAGPLQFGGLGQLSDGVLGLDDFVRTRERRLWPGYDYVGWPRPAGPRPHLELEFEFQGLRTFQAMQVHCNNLHTRGVRIFGAAECRFKRSLASAWEDAVATHSPGATQDPRARSVTVPLGGRRARFVRCRFFFAAEWMLFSEVTFLSDAVEEGAGSSGWPPPAPPPDSSRGGVAFPENPWSWNGATNGTTLAPKLGQPMAKAEPGHSSTLIGCLVAIILLLLAVIALILCRHRWGRALGK